MTTYRNGEAVTNDLDQAEDRGVYAAVSFDALALEVACGRVADFLTTEGCPELLDSIVPGYWRALYDLTRTSQQLAVLAGVVAGRLAGWAVEIPEDEREFADRMAKRES